MPEFKNLTSLFNHLQTVIDEVMETDVFEAVQAAQSDAIIDKVYSVYSPKQYKRRGEAQGLGDESNIVIEGGKVKDGKLVVINITEPSDPMGGVTNSEDFQKLIIGGQGYDGLYYDYPYPEDAPFLKPRDFIEETKNLLRTTKAHFVMMKYGLKRRGHKVEK